MDAVQTIPRQSYKPDTHIKPDITISPDEYMQDRVIYKINLYDRLGDEQKWLYWGTSLVSIVLAASVPVLINLGVDVIIPTVLSLIVTILVAVEKLFHFREHWRNYDEIAAFLRSEQLLFQTGTGDYKEKEKSCELAYQRFVTRVERAICNERADTIEMRTQGNTE